MLYALKYVFLLSSRSGYGPPVLRSNLPIPVAFLTTSLAVITLISIAKL